MTTTATAKNGINVGFFTVHHMIHEGLKPGDAAKLGFDYEIVIAGSGPSGISAAMTARQENFKYVVLEKRETFAATIYDYPKKNGSLMDYFTAFGCFYPDDTSYTHTPSNCELQSDICTRTDDFNSTFNSIKHNGCYVFPGDPEWDPRFNGEAGAPRVPCVTVYQRDTLAPADHCKYVRNSKPVWEPPTGKECMIVVGNDGWEAVVTDIIGIHDYDSDPRRMSGRYRTEEQSVHDLFRHERPGHRARTSIH